MIKLIILSLASIIDDFSSHLYFRYVEFFGGNPNWYSFNFAPSAIPDMTLSDHILDTIGILEFTGGEKLFSIDGQHRIDGIKQALIEQADKFVFDELPIIIIAHSDTKQGKVRTRRLFSEINTKALKVSGLDDLITNEDNPIDINTRRLFAEFEHFKKDKFIALNATTNVTVEANEFTSILNLRGVNKILYESIFKFQEARPSDEEIHRLYQVSFDFWTEAVNKIPKYQQVMIEESHLASEFRNKEDGGSMLFKPIGIDTLAESYTCWRAERGNTNHFWDEFVKIDDTLNGEYWNYILWDNAKKTVIASRSLKFRREYSKYLLGLNHDLEYIQVEYSKMKGGEDANLSLVDLPNKP